MNNLVSAYLGGIVGAVLMDMGSALASSWRWARASSASPLRRAGSRVEPRPFLAMLVLHGLCDFHKEKKDGLLRKTGVALGAAGRRASGA